MIDHLQRRRTPGPAVRAALKIGRYRARLGWRRCATLALDRSTSGDSPAPAVTIFTANINTRYSLELMLQSLRRNTTYPNYVVWIADNASTDGSREFLDAYRQRHEIRLSLADESRTHPAWLDDVAQKVDTPYWVAVDSDLLFTGRDWLWDLIRRMEADRDLQLLAAEPKPGRVGPAPGSEDTWVHAPSFASWLFCVRTSLWATLPEPTFLWEVRRGVGEERGHLLDTGAKLLEQMDAQGLKHAVMPARYRRKFFHYGNMSWLEPGGQSAHARLKRHQMADVQRRVRAGRC